MTLTGIPTRSDDLDVLATALDATIPARTATNLLVATWNLRMFGGLTATWDAGPSDSPKRDLHSLACIASIVRRFDVVAVQEVKRNVTALRQTLQLLGTDWAVIASDVTEGDPGNEERLAFLYDTTRVEPSGLVAEIVLPLSTGSVRRQFARTPYAAGFRAGDVEFILVCLHVIWGDRTEQRLAEVRSIAEWMRAWVDRPNDWNANLLVLGDFNLDRIGDPLYEAFLSTGLWPPTELNAVPRTIFDKPTTPHFYDQIAWFSDADGRTLLRSLTYTGRAGTFDFTRCTMTDLSKESLSFKISDHLPLWVEFERGKDADTRRKGRP
jgi:endonuclease/exonuclease/phosphatase family metal-dependent hydrolase